MNIGTGENLDKVIIDTNIIVSAIGFGGKPRDVLLLSLGDKFIFVTSPMLLAELRDVINKKFPELIPQLSDIEEIIIRKFQVVQPKESLSIVNDEDDNRVLEAAIEGKCDYIITGDKELLDLGLFKKVKILTPDQFLKEIGYKDTL